VRFRCMNVEGHALVRLGGTDITKREPSILTRLARTPALLI
jgi:hypothetical protein